MFLHPLENQGCPGCYQIFLLCPNMMELRSQSKALSILETAQQTKSLPGVRPHFPKPFTESCTVDYVKEVLCPPIPEITSKTRPGKLKETLMFDFGPFLKPYFASTLGDTPIEDYTVMRWPLYITITYWDPEKGHSVGHHC